MNAPHSALRALLADGQWHGMDELRRVAGWRYGSRKLELERGEDGGPPCTIEARRIPGSTSAWQYRLKLGPATSQRVAPPPPAPPPRVAAAPLSTGPRPVVQSAETARAWDAVFAGRAFAGADVRHTTSSRRPGRAIVGAVRRGRRRIEQCPACGGWAYPLAGLERQVDCQGREATC